MRRPKRPVRVPVYSNSRYETPTIARWALKLAVYAQNHPAQGQRAWSSRQTMPAPVTLIIAPTECIRGASPRGQIVPCARKSASGGSTQTHPPMKSAAYPKSDPAISALSSIDERRRPAMPGRAPRRQPPPRIHREQVPIHPRRAPRRLIDQRQPRPHHPIRVRRRRVVGAGFRHRAPLKRRSSPPIDRRAREAACLPPDGSLRHRSRSAIDGALDQPIYSGHDEPPPCQSQPRPGRGGRLRQGRR